MLTTFARRFTWTVAMLAILLGVGTVGYIFIEQQTLGDALYMTAITLSAVGFEEVWPLSGPGRVFTMVLLLGGITWLGLWFANITSFIVELDLGHALRRRRNMREIASMKGHVIICGAGRTGRQVAQELHAAKSAFVIIEKHPERITEMREYLQDAPVLEGDATHDHVLLAAGLVEAKGLVTCLSADTDNLFVCLSARDLAAKVTIVARAYEEETKDKLYRAGADHVVSPNVSSAIRIASVLIHPTALSFIDIATRSTKSPLRIHQAPVPEHSPVVGRSLEEVQIPSKTGLLVIAIRRKDAASGDFEFNPVGGTRLAGGDEIIVMGLEDQLGNLREVLGE